MVDDKYSTFADTGEGEERNATTIEEYERAREIGERLGEIDERAKMQREIPLSQRIMWWGYLHANGSLQVKRWFGDHKDYTEDCEGNDFVQQVVPPFEAQTQEEAEKIISQAISK